MKIKSFIVYKLIPAIVILSLLGILVVINVQGIKNDKKAEELLRYDYFNSFCLETFSGDVFSEANLSDYNVTIINAWGPYCDACLREMPMLNKLSREYADKKVAIVGIQADSFLFPEDIELSRSQIAEMGIEYQNLLADGDFNQKIAGMLNNSLPGTWIVDSNGNILDFFPGTKTEKEWREILNLYAE